MNAAADDSGLGETRPTAGSGVNAAADDGGLGETRPTAVVPLAHRSLAR
ncbi:MAG: hypothetical protein GX230_10435 [Lentisphaerae bacterium]|nr:hypothetical protein [Lentisphaerota bacterium]